MGGKSSSAPAPDPRLIEAQIKSMGVQDGAIQGILGLQKELQPLQKEQMQFGLDSGREAWKQSQEDRKFALGKRGQLSSLQDQLSNEARTFNTEGKREELAAQAIGDVNQAFSAARDSNARQMARMGVNPNSGRSLAMGNQLSVAQALGQSQAAGGARFQARAEGRALTDRATNALAGYPAMSMGATGAGAQFAANGINIANAGMSGMSSGFGSAAQIAGGMGSNATNMWGQQSNYKNQQDQNSQEGFGAIIGAGAKLGAAAMPYMFSDRRMKEGIELVGEHEATGLNLYEFSYIDDPDMRRFRGVMADEVVKVAPDAVLRHEDGFDRVNYQALGLELVEV